MSMSNMTQTVCNINITINSSTSPECKRQPIEALAYSLVFLLGLLVNAAALLAFLDKRISWTDTHIYMLNLVMADTSLILFLPFRIYDAFFCLETNKLCTFLIFIHYTNMYASILTTMAISLQRYLVVRFPLQARAWKKKKETACAVCCLIWGTLVTMWAIFQGNNHPDKLWTCYERCKNIPLDEKFIFIMVCVGYVVPLLIIGFCSSCIIRILLKVKNMSVEMKPIIGIITTNMIVFIVCYTPIHVAFVVNYYHILPKWNLRPFPEHIFLLVSEWIASTNCCFDSISYYFLLKHFYR